MFENSSRVVVEESPTARTLVKDFAVIVSPEARAKPARSLTLLRAAIGIPLLALAMALILLGLMPAVLVVLVAFLPALAPLILVGLGILATAEMKTPDVGRPCDPNKPCCCGRHGVGLEHAVHAPAGRALLQN